MDFFLLYMSFLKQVSVFIILIVVDITLDHILKCRFALGRVKKCIDMKTKNSEDYLIIAHERFLMKVDI